MKDFTIEPLKGYGEIPFGMTLDETVKKLGMPDFYEELSDMEETGNRSIFYEYDELETNIYFEGVTKSVVACFETENMDPDVRSRVEKPQIQAQRRGGCGTPV